MSTLFTGKPVSSVSEASHFQILLDSLYAMYSRSPKDQRELEVHAQELSVRLLKVGRVSDIRWVFSSFRAVKTLWRDYPALCQHLLACADDENRTLAKRSKCRGLLKKLTNWFFVGELAMMKDALRCLQELSLFLQKESASVVDALFRVEGVCTTFKALKEQSGKSVSVFLKQWGINQTFKSVSLSAPSEK